MHVARAHMRAHPTFDRCKPLSWWVSIVRTKFEHDRPSRCRVIARGLFLTPLQSARATFYSDHVGRSASVTYLVGGMGLSNTEDG